MSNVLFLNISNACKISNFVVAKFEVYFENDELKTTTLWNRVVSASGSETRDSSSTPASAVIYDTYNSIIKKQHFGIVQQEFNNISKLKEFLTSVNTNSIDTVASKLHPTALLVAWAQQPKKPLRLSNAYSFICSLG